MATAMSMEMAMSMAMAMAMQCVLCRGTGYGAQCDPKSGSQRRKQGTTPAEDAAASGDRGGERDAAPEEDSDAAILCWVESLEAKLKAKARERARDARDGATADDLEVRS